MIAQANRIFLWGKHTFAIGLIGALAGCAAPNGTLRQAQEAYEKARQDQQIQEMAPVELHQAGETVRMAEEASGQTETAHLARIAQRRVEIARVEAQRRAAEAEAERLLKKRDQIMLESRDRELAALKAELTERGFVMTLGDVLFDYNRASLRSGAQQNLYRLVSFLKAHPKQDIIIEGHTDSRGSASYNLNLSERRAQAVQNFLVSNGVDPRRITVRGYGEAYPVASNASEAGRQQNRRVEIVFPKTGQSSSGREMKRTSAPW